MKKFLLLAVSVLMMATANAQVSSLKDAGKPVSKTTISAPQTRESFKAVEAKNVAAVNVNRNLGQKRTFAKAQTMTQVQTGLPMLQVPATGFQKVNNKAGMGLANAPKNAAPAALKAAYKGNCNIYDFDAKGWNKATEWDVTPGTVTYETNTYDCIYDVFPANDLFNEPAEFLYYAEGNNLIIPVEAMGQYNETTLIYYMDYTSFSKGGDGSIVLELASDGTLSIPAANATHVFGWFAATFNPSTYAPVSLLGAFSQYAGFEFTVAGGGDDNFVSEAKYTGKGKNYSSSSAVEWTMEMGNIEGTPVIRNIAPSLFSNGPMDVVATVAGNIIKIAPQKIAENEYDGEMDYIYLSSYASADGTITITKDPATGYLTLPEGEGVVIGGFSTDKFDPEYGDTYTGYYQITTDVKFFAEGQPIPNPAPEVYADALYDGMLYAGMGASGYHYQNNLALVPAYADVTFKNYTTDENTGFKWTAETSVDEGETPKDLSTTEKNLVISTDPTETYTGISLVGYNNAEVSDPYKVGWNGENEACYIYASGTADSYEFTDGSLATITANNPDNGIKFYTNWATPDMASNEMTKIYIAGFKPVAPLYITGLTFPVVNFTDLGDFNLTAQICKASRSSNGKLNIGEVIAQCDANSYNVVDEYAETSGLTAINFNSFYVFDEDSMTEDIDHLFLDEEFCIVLDGWNNGTFTAVLGSEENPHALALQPTYFEMAGAPGSMYAYGSWRTHIFCGYEGAAYGYLKTDDNTDVTIAPEGGSATISIKPMLCSVEDDVRTTRLFLDEEVPEWISLDIANEKYDNEFGFDLVITADAIEEGEGREASFRVFQEGAYLDITVKQGASTGIKTVVKQVASKGGKTFNIAGQEVDRNAKGIVICDGMKLLQK